MLVRMLNMNKWNHDFIKNGTRYHGDAISDLKCSGNTLSVWVANNQTEINEAVLSLALGRDDIQKINIVLLDESCLHQIYKIDIATTPGTVPIARLQSRHRDLADMDFWSMGFIAEHIGRQLKSPSNFKTYTKKQVELLIRDAISRNEVILQNLNPKLKENLGL